jgi:uncharacterized RDD family membrane protein YckC
MLDSVLLSRHVWVMSDIKPLYGQLHERFLARLIDGVITLPALQIIIALSANYAEFASLLGFVFGLAYYGLFAASAWQATPGKRLLGLYICKQDGTRLRRPDAIARELAVMIPAYPVYVSFLSPQIAAMLFLGLAIIWYGRILNSPKRTAMHDLLCHTLVRRGRLGSIAA